MKHQQVVVDYWSMVKTSCTCLLLALSGYILIKMVQTIFWLPGYLQNNQKRLEELAKQYALEIENDELTKDDDTTNEVGAPAEKAIDAAIGSAKPESGDTKKEL